MRKKRRHKIRLMPSTTDADNPVPELIERIAREKYGSIGQLAKEIGVFRGSISAITNRQKTLGPDLARKLAPALGVSQLRLFQMAGLITDQYDDQDSEAIERIKLLLKDANADVEEEAANVIEAIVKSRAKAEKPSANRNRLAGRKT